MLLLIIVVILASCREDVVNQEIVIPASAKITYVENNKEIDNFFLIPGDTTGDGISDITVKVPYIRLMERICFLRQIYPGRDIVIISGSVSSCDGELVFNAGAAILKE